MSCAACGAAGAAYETDDDYTTPFCDELCQLEHHDSSRGYTEHRGHRSDHRHGRRHSERSHRDRDHNYNYSDSDSDQDSAYVDADVTVDADASVDADIDASVDADASNEDAAIRLPWRSKKPVAALGAAKTDLATVLQDGARVGVALARGVVAKCSSSAARCVDDAKSIASIVTRAVRSDAQTLLPDTARRFFAEAISAYDAEDKAAQLRRSDSRVSEAQLRVQDATAKSANLAVFEVGSGATTVRAAGDIVVSSIVALAQSLSNLAEATPLLAVREAAIKAVRVARFSAQPKEYAELRRVLATTYAQLAPLVPAKSNAEFVRAALAGRQRGGSAAALAATAAAAVPRRR